ncbi:protein of unknown function [Caballeronia sp. S22]
MFARYLMHACTMPLCSDKPHAKGLCKRCYNKQYALALPDAYVRRVADLSADTPAELVELHRLIIQIRREVRKRS